MTTNLHPTSLPSRENLLSAAHTCAAQRSVRTPGALPQTTHALQEIHWASPPQLQATRPGTTLFYQRVRSPQSTGGKKAHPLNLDDFLPGIELGHLHLAPAPQEFHLL